MDKALVIGASGGVGKAIVAELEGRGVAVTTLSRSENGLDITDEDSVRNALDGLKTDFDLIFVATGGLTSTRDTPEKQLGDLGGDELLEQMKLNALGPALVLKHWKDRIPRKSRFVFAVLSARVGSIGDNRMGGWYSYRTSKAALNSLLHGAAVEIARTRKDAIVTCLHPGTVATQFTADYPDHDKVSPEEAAKNLIDLIEGLTPDQTGQFFDYAGERIDW